MKIHRITKEMCEYVKAHPRKSPASIAVHLGISPYSVGRIRHAGCDHGTYVSGTRSRYEDYKNKRSLEYVSEGFWEDNKKDLPEGKEDAYMRIAVAVFSGTLAANLITNLIF